MHDVLLSFMRLIRKSIKSERILLNIHKWFKYQYYKELRANILRYYMQLTPLKEIYLVYRIWMNPPAVGHTGCATSAQAGLSNPVPCPGLHFRWDGARCRESQVLWRCYVLWLGNTGWEIVNDRTGCEGGVQLATKCRQQNNYFVLTSMTM